MSIAAMTQCWGANFPVKAKGVSAAVVRLVALSVADVVNDANDNEFYGSVKRLAAKVALSRETVGLAMKHLVDVGVLEHLEDRPGGTTRYRWHGVTELPSPLSERSVGGDGTARRDPNSSQPSQSSLRSEQLDHRVATEYWEWYVGEYPGLKPTIVFPALRKVAEKLLEAGHQPDDIVDAMKTAKAWTAKALGDEIGAKKHASEGQPSTAAIPHALVRAFAKAQPFFDRRWGGLEKPARVEAMRRCAQLVSAGYGIGETMVRLAIVVRAGNPMVDYALQNVPIPRFEGELDDYPDAMERAWTNRTWSIR